MTKNHMSIISGGDWDAGAGPFHKILGLILAAVLILLNGCAAVPKDEYNSDPWEGVNRKVYKFNRVLDKHLVKPVADTYVKVTHVSLRRRITNFFTNLNGINVFLNDYLQGKFKQGFADTTRFVLNSTFGILGLFDIATEFGFKQHEEDFGQTLAVWGVGPGPYLMLPVLGPYTLRNTPGFAFSYYTNPLFLVDDLRITIPLATLGLVDLRASAEGAISFIDEAAVDPYAFMREAYLQRRNFLIHDGSPPVDDLFDELDLELEDELR
ncbi:MAG: VacJ family lipoprotein [Gammaproteobacteria bacterium]|nr:VacJ family lipoprotein [Gammaproteobacteria bacterium]